MEKIEVKQILNKKKHRDAWFLDDYTLNPYSACSFNCLFCYIRGSKYGVHMERKVSVKSNAPELLEKSLKNLSKKGKYGYIMLSSATDPYLHFEAEEKMTRQLLEIIAHYKFPLHLLTRSDLVLRDFDLLHKIDNEAILPKELVKSPGRGLLLSYSFSGVSDEVAAIFEPGATPPRRRLEVLNASNQAGFLTGVSMMPLLPFITDTGKHLEEMYTAFKKNGAHYVMPASLTLFGEDNSSSKQLMFRAIDKHYPALSERYRKWFSNHHQLPKYYREAFSKKMNTLSKEYQLQQTIMAND